VKTKLIEIRDRATMITALCVDMNPNFGDPVQRYYLRRYGYACDGKPNVLITHAAGNGTPANNDPYSWQGRTWRFAHNYIIEHWNELADGDVVDVEFILGETTAPKVSERLTGE
jgi:hypothetical protein